MLCLCCVCVSLFSPQIDALPTLSDCNPSNQEIECTWSPDDYISWEQTGTRGASVPLIPACVAASKRSAVGVEILCDLVVR